MPSPRALLAPSCNPDPRVKTAAATAKLHFRPMKWPKAYVPRAPKKAPAMKSETMFSLIKSCCAEVMSSRPNSALKDFNVIVVPMKALV